MLRIFALPAPFPDGEWIQQRQLLVNAAKETPIPTIVETQKPAKLLASAGDRVHSSTGVPGTLGGFLRNGPHGAIYAVTCGHVIAAGSASTAAGHLGLCIHAAAPKPLPAGTTCSANCPHVTDLDVALIDVSATPVNNRVTSVAPIISPGDVVEMNGASSGARRYEVGGAVVEHAIGGSCWNKLSIIHAPVSTGLLPVAIGVGMTPPPQGGDSGAWLIRNGGEWAGMIVAGNPLLGFAMSGTDILQNANATFGTQLQLA
jgi:hypothetical protein